MEWGHIPSQKRYLAVVSKLEEERARHRRRLTMDERQAVDGYVNKRGDATGQRINRYLYRDPYKTNTNHVIVKQVALIDSAFRSSRMRAPRTLFRGLSGPGVACFTAKWAPNSKVTFPSYLSTSFMPLQALLYGVGGCILKLEVPPGWEIPVLWSPMEDEIVLPRGLSWLVRRVVDRLAVPPRITRHPIHGSHMSGTDTSTRMFVMSLVK
ncbi:MAG: hypothetical protein WDW38_006684 [Sanguina aurantia]